MAALVSNVIARLKRQYDDTLGEISNDLYYDWLNDLNFLVYRELYNRDPNRFISSDTVSVTSGTSGYNLPSDFKNINPVGCGVYETDSDGDLKDDQLVQRSAGSSDTGFYLTNAQVVFTPEPSASATYKLRYIPTISAIDATTDSMVIDEEDMIAIINWLDKNYGQWNLDIIKENNADSRFVRDLVNLLENSQTSPRVFILN
jgi:hypothetical protein